MPMLRRFVVSAFPIVLLSSLIHSFTAQPLLADERIAESAEEIKPLRSGQRAPNFIVRDVNGKAVNFDPDALERPTLIITFRGGWCPFCNFHLSELHTVVPEIAALGVDILFLSGDRPELLYESLSAETRATIAELDYTIYSDADAQAAIAFGLAFKASEQTIQRRADQGQDVAGSSMLEHGVLPVPAVYAIDRSGTIRFDFVEADYTVRLPAAELLAVAEEIVE